MDYLSIIFLVILYIYGISLLYITSISRKKGEIQAFYNNLFISLVLIGSLTMNLINIYILRDTTTDLIIFPFNLAIIVRKINKCIKMVPGKNIILQH
jgi:hypothetical protein